MNALFLVSEEEYWGEERVEPLTTFDAAGVDGDDGTALVACHAVGVLAFTRDADGGFLASGRDVTGSRTSGRRTSSTSTTGCPTAETALLGRRGGAGRRREFDADASVTVDGDLVTARGPESSSAAAETLLDELGVAATN